MPEQHEPLLVLLPPSNTDSHAYLAKEFCDRRASGATSFLIASRDLFLAAQDLCLVESGSSVKQGTSVYTYIYIYILLRSIFHFCSRDNTRDDKHTLSARSTMFEHTPHTPVSYSTPPARIRGNRCPRTDAPPRNCGSLHFVLTEYCHAPKSGSSRQVSLLLAFTGEHLYLRTQYST